MRFYPRRGQRALPVLRKARAVKVFFSIFSTLRHANVIFAQLNVLFCFPAASLQQRSQIEELRKFGKEFRVRKYDNSVSVVYHPVLY